jgi:hypothetical protein
MTATALSGSLQVAAQPLMSDSSVQLHNLGETISSNDGRRFRYAQAGASALVAGTLQQTKAETTANENLTAVAAAVGDFTIATTSTVTVTANQYAGGLAIITVTPGVGYAYAIKSHPAATAAALSLTLVDSIQVALTTTSRIDLVENPYKSVVINPATATQSPVGSAVYPITALYYGWLQTGGQASLLADGTVTVGTTLVASNGVAGAVEAFAGVQAVVGIAMTGIATTEYGAVRLMLN